MKLSTQTIFGVLLLLLTAATPATLASSATVSAQTPTPTPPVELPAPAPAPAPIQVEPAALPAPAPAPAPQPDQRHIECIAKIIMHEAADEPRPGRIAVAQVIRARIRDGRFASTACGVAHQRGQFFDVDAFQPSRSSAKWQDAVAIAAQTLAGEGAELVPGALFFHASYSPMPGRQRLGQIGGHVFYR